MRYPIEVIATRFGPPPDGSQAPSLTVVYGPAAWARIATEDPSYPELVPKDFDWGTRLLLWVKTTAGGGADVEPVITELSREGNRVRVLAETRVRPNPQGLDVFLQPWLLAAAPRVAFDGNPEVGFEVRGQEKGTVQHERD